MESRPAKGDTPLERLETFFSITTRGLCRKPKYARAVLRAMASGEPEVAAHVAAYNDRMTGLIIAAIRGVGRLGTTAGEPEPSASEKNVAEILQRMWFASLVGWSAGLHGQSDVIDQTRVAAELVLAGVAAQNGEPLEMA